jgi:hypothetical protein
MYMGTPMTTLSEQEIQRNMPERDQPACGTCDPGANRGGKLKAG